MKITVQNSKLSKALNNVSRVAISRATLPILNNVLIRVDDKKVSLITTNLDMAVIDFLPVSDSEDGVITVPAKLLADFVSNLPKNETVEISSEDTKITIKAGKYSSIINGVPADDFPELPELDEKSSVTFKMGVDEFKNSISQVIVAASNDLSRPSLTGVCFCTNNNTLAIAATDGYRLTEKKIIKDVKSEIKAIVPASSLQEVLRSITDDVEEVEFSFDSDLVRFRLGDVEVVSKLIDGSYPDYTKLIPEKSNINLTIKKEELTRAAKLAALFSRSVGGTIICESIPPDTLLIKSVANEFGENDSKIEVPVETAGHVSVNSRLFIDALNCLEDPIVSFSFSDHVAPAVLQNNKKDQYIHVVMPLNS